MATKATTKADGLTEFSAQELPKEELLEWYRRMSSIRAFENRLHLENQSGDIPGFIHLYAGEEAIAVGVCALLNRTDYIVSTHRGHGHCLAKGCNVRGMMLEIFGKQEGVCHGKGGSMHIADLSVGMLGANGIVGGGPNLGIGAALTAKYLKNQGVSVSFTGDGGSNQGMVFEAINMAKVLNLPMVFVFENNGMGEATGASFAVGGGNISGRAASFGIPAVKVDGTDFFAVYDAAAEAVARARSGEGPSVIEATAYRYFGHFEGDAGLYRTPEQLQELKDAHDPLQIFRQKAPKGISVAELDQIDAACETEVDESVAYARQAAWPEPEDLTKDVYLSY